jgi:hypothetical protein
MDSLIHLVSLVVVPLFFVGMAGSAIVVVVAFADDMKELLEDDD